MSLSKIVILDLQNCPKWEVGIVLLAHMQVDIIVTMRIFILNNIFEDIQGYALTPLKYKDAFHY